MAVAEPNMKEVLTQKAHELFQLCDRENKGFIGKRDMQRMIAELPLEPDQLEDVFDSLDIDKNGFLTLEEFTNGFGSFLGVTEDGGDSADEQPVADEHQNDDARQRKWRQKAEEEQDAEEQFADFIMQAGAAELIGENDASIQQMWLRLVSDSPDGGDPALLGTFSRLLKEISTRVRKAKAEQESLENALKNQQDTMQTQMKNMFEEMEAQIASERDRKELDEEQKQQKIREDLEAQVAIKELEAQMTRQRVQELSSQLEMLSTSDVQQKQENAQLQKQKDDFEEEVLRQKKIIAELQSSIDQNRSLTLEDKRKRAMAAFSVTENIASEREDLVKQLDLLKSINTRLMDERDSRRRISPVPRVSQGERLSDILSANEIKQQADVQTTVAALMAPDIHPTKHLDVPDCRNDFQDSDVEVDEIFYQNNPDVVQRVPVIPLSSAWKGPLQLQGGSLMEELLEEEDVVKPLPIPKNRAGQQDVSAGSETDDMHVIDRHRKRSRHNSDRRHSSTLLIYHQGKMPKSDTEKSDTSVTPSVNGVPRASSPTPSNVSTLVQPQRVYKVVIIGDAGVGKSSFVQRFCTGEVRPSYAATIGVDFQVQSVVIDGQTVCIQLWDTAGQERFRSITKQYFRKADGVFVMFDVTSETSFRNCREWIQNVKDLAAEETSLILLGNKTDLCPDASLRVVKPETGAALAADCSAVYHECSALRDIGVTSVIELMGELLLQREDDSMEMALRLVPQKEPKKKCCKK